MLETSKKPQRGMGYPRFGAVGALLLARLCISTPMPLEGPELRLFGIMLLAEICEDLCSWEMVGKSGRWLGDLGDGWEIGKLQTWRKTQMAKTINDSSHQLHEFLQFIFLCKVGFPLASFDCQSVFVN